ncbi:hypothetical protein RRG08_001979 [Elysia crispata]|uniref:Uncharacterized protein n=1 Tax=Elysia crispata TaxID=231223 RepID=A0AAE1BAS2_9GAST|nr:hypothetical protein RRG08_001979 [Elysia crispata]
MGQWQKAQSWQEGNLKKTVPLYRKGDHCVLGQEFPSGRSLNPEGQIETIPGLHGSLSADNISLQMKHMYVT